MKQSVLVVDDSLTVRMDLAEAFEMSGFHVVPCSTIAEARAALARETIGLVVLDVLLPDGDGVDFLRELRAPERSATPAVMMLSAEAEVKDRIRGLKTGADEYVGKPYNTKYVIAKARELLRGREASGSGADKATVLVVDDSETFRNTLAAALAEAGYAVLAAASGTEGLAIIADRRPAGIIVDGVMPDMDGATLIRRVRLDAAVRTTPCVLLTASEDAGAQLRALEAGADAFVRKDEHIDVILARLSAAMRHPPSVPSEEMASLLGPRKILAVDDSPTYLHELAATLREEGYDVMLARSGEEALELLAVQAVDCILLDLMMPGIGGKETCRRIKSAPVVRDIPLIMLTALDDRTAMLEGLGAGADDYISKSSEFEVLRARVRAQMRRKQFEDENRRIRDELIRREFDAQEAKNVRELADGRALMVQELERQVEERTRALEAEVVERRHAERMASVGMMSASIAHEINNPLAVTSGNLEIVALKLASLVRELASVEARHLPPDELADRVATGLTATEEPMRDALEAAGRVRDIVRDLRIFSRSDEDAPIGPVDIHRILESSFRMASNEVRHRARLVRMFQPGYLYVRGHETRLGQVFLNLVVNAAQAMPEGRAGDNTITVTTRSDGDRVTIEVRDTGVGIAADKLVRVFDPFFTTKPAGQGTGLGLAISHRIVTELGGDISVTSDVGKGTVFSVVLPRAEPAIAASEKATKRELGTPSRGRILVVDDEPTICRTVERILGAEHEVTVSNEAAAAIRLIGDGARFDVILSDMMMPEINGMELHDRLMALAPDQAQRMVFVTGGAFSPEAAAFLRKTGNATVEKPFRAATLQALVRERLSPALDENAIREALRNR